MHSRPVSLRFRDLKGGSPAYSCDSGRASSEYSDSSTFTIRLEPTGVKGGDEHMLRRPQSLLRQLRLPRVATVMARP